MNDHHNNDDHSYMSIDPVGLPDMPGRSVSLEAAMNDISIERAIRYVQDNKTKIRGSYGMDPIAVTRDGIIATDANLIPDRLYNRIKAETLLSVPVVVGTLDGILHNEYKVIRPEETK